MSCGIEGRASEEDSTAAAVESRNSLSLNGIALNGIALNGIALNGIALNGIALDGIALNGTTLDGIALNGIALDGIALNGIALDGIALDGIDLDGIDLNNITLNGIMLRGAVLNDIRLDGSRLSGVSMNGLDSRRVHLSGTDLSGIRLGGLALEDIDLRTAAFGGAALDGAQTANLKLLLAYTTRCALAPSQCVAVTDTDGTIYQLCGEYGLDSTWNTDIATSIADEQAVTECVLGVAGGAGHTVSHTNHERLAIRSLFHDTIACALPSGTCVQVTDIGGSTYGACGADGLDPSWLTGPPTQGAVAAQVASCVGARAAARGDTWLDRRAQVQRTLRYAAECALRPDQSITVTDWDGSPIGWQGALGLAEWWASAALRPAPSWRSAADGEELVSACLMARSNALGLTVDISLRARPELGADTTEAATYTRHEGAFMGNLFLPVPVSRSCSGPANAPVLNGRACASGTKCGFQYLGPCDSVCAIKPGGGETLYDECAGNANVVNTFLAPP